MSKIIAYHGTHKRNEDDIKNNGIKIPGKGYTAGTISLASKPDTAYGYSAMAAEGGESGFRDTGAKGKAKPKATKHENRIVFKIEIPKEWHEENLDRTLYKGEYLEEHRYKKNIPSEFIKGKVDRFGNSLKESIKNFKQWRKENS